MALRKFAGQNKKRAGEKILNRLVCPAEVIMPEKNSSDP
tara:strand:+ start:38723 stop:38839 length:117 start_codon:yes stop_codon:yes gene_type:complete